MDLKTNDSAGALATGGPAARAGAAGGGHVLPEHPVIRVRPQGSGPAFDLRELWDFRELLYFLTWRDLKVRYKQTVLGIAWVIVQPVLTMLAFTVFFNRLGGFRSEGMPYPLFAYAGLLLWTFFSNAVIYGTNSLIQNSNLVTKVYFPRMFIPAAAVAAGLVDLAVASVVLFALALYYEVALGWSLLLLPIFVALTVLLATAVGLLASASTVRYRDLKHALPFLIQLWLFASPVIYSSSAIPARWRWVYFANPLAGIIDGFRAALMGHAFDWPAVGAAAAITLVLLSVSLYLFRRIEETFADVI
ncbi:MAG TPA: ABC transporter permease [Pyrinomonadaceae bacterium]|nr:ABC transporter permease [Pyrinomonadaceae bacterium]